MDLVSQNLLMTSGGGKKEDYVDDLFSTYLWRGNETARTIPSGVDNTKGGLVWVKARNDSAPHQFVDTERGANKILFNPANSAESTIANRITGFINNGFHIGSAGQVNGTSAYKYAGWNFRKAEGFFDIVKYTGDGTSQNISHSLACAPGMIIVKAYDQSGSNGNWWVYHRSLGTNKYLQFNVGSTASSLDNAFSVSSTTFSSHSSLANVNGANYVAYLFADGANPNLSKGLKWVNSGSDVSCGSNSQTTSDFHVGSSTAFTIECWIQPYSNPTGWGRICHLGNNSSAPSWTSNVLALEWSNSGTNGTNRIGLRMYNWSSNQSNNFFVSAPHPEFVDDGQFHHVALTRDTNNKFRLFVDGVLEATRTTSVNINTGATALCIGNSLDRPSNSWFNGAISNFRFTKDQALYTAEFTPITSPLTTTSQGATGSNVKLLCCNQVSPTGATVTPFTLTEDNINNDGALGLALPFSDPLSFIYGENEDQNLVRCGSYKGNGSTTGTEVNIGWEPQFIIIKAAENSGGQQWRMLDCMRGISTDHNDNRLYPSEDTGEETNVGIVNLTSKGFNLTTTDSSVNGSGATYVYIAIRRPDGRVGKPAKAGNEVFTVVNGDTDGDAKTPWMLTPHIVDFALFKGRNITHNWGTSPRLTQGYYLSVNQTRAENANIHQVFDFMDGFNEGTDTSGNYTGWLWKRGAGMDVVTYKGNSSSYNTNVINRQIRHSLGRVPEMMWIKDRSVSENWFAWHSGLNSGTTPEQWSMELNNTAAQAQITYMHNTAPTATRFTVGTHGMVNGNNNNYCAFLFASIDGISKVGYYTGTGVSGLAVTTGFTPRFLIVKNASWSSGDWFVYDTVRGWTSGNDAVLQLNSSGPQVVGTTHDIDPTSTGFTVQSTDAAVNNNGHNFIYYAHA